MPTVAGNTNGGLISAGVLQLSPATSTTPGLVTTGTQSFNGYKTFFNDIFVNGIRVGRGVNSAGNCVAVGSNSLVGNTGQYNTCVGDGTMPFNTSGASNTAIGFQALYNTNGSLNTAVGQNSLFNSVGGNNNVAIGASSGIGITSGGSNVCIGNGSGVNIGSGSNNVHVGIGTTATINSSNEIVIGYTAGGFGSNTAVIGNNSITRTILRGTVCIGVTSPDASAKLQVDSTSQGFLPPRVANAASIVAPVAGLIIYDQSVNKLKCWNGTIWNDLF